MYLASLRLASFRSKYRLQLSVQEVSSNGTPEFGLSFPCRWEDQESTWHLQTFSFPCDSASPKDTLNDGAGICAGTLASLPSARLQTGSQI
jgi:hypothetical protein